jgi:hypothetical protein
VSSVAVTIANVVAPPPDVTPPTVSITSPAAGNVSGTVTIAANAADNVGVSRVEFYVNGTLVGTDNAAPYTYSWNTTTLPNGADPLCQGVRRKSRIRHNRPPSTVTVANVTARLRLTSLPPHGRRRLAHRAAFVVWLSVGFSSNAAG